jgi:type III secretory pathway component EscS
MKKTIFITIMFAFGHGLMLFIFAKLLQIYDLPESITAYGDIISSSVIILMGIYLLTMVATNKIQLSKHIHNNKEHIHIYFAKKHSHNIDNSTVSAWGIGALMGIGGVRGMLVTLTLLQGNTIEWTIILIFVLGISLVFLSFGASILYLNTHYLTNIINVRRVFTTAGVLSIAVGINMLLA